MRKLKFSATVTAVLGLFAVVALVMLSFLLSDIAKSGTEYKGEWYVAGICIIVLSAFTISTFITLAFFMKSLQISERLTAETHMNGSL